MYLLFFADVALAVLSYSFNIFFKIQLKSFYLYKSRKYINKNKITQVNALVNPFILALIEVTEASFIKPYPFFMNNDKINKYSHNITRDTNLKELHATSNNVESINASVSSEISDNRGISLNRTYDVLMTTTGIKFLDEFPKNISDGMYTTQNTTKKYRFFENPWEIEQSQVDEYHRITKRAYEENLNVIGISLIVIYSGMIICALLRNVIVNLRLSVGIQAPLLLYGIFIGVCFRLVPSEYAIISLFPNQNKIVVFIAVPLMLYKACLTADLPGLRKKFFQVLVISVPGLLANAILVGITMQYLLGKNWSFVSCTFFGTACVFIYPKQNIEILKELDAQSQQIAILLEGELILEHIFVFALFVTWFGGYMAVLSTYQMVVNLLKYFSGFLIGFVAGTINTYLFLIFSSNIVDLFLFPTIFPLLVFYVCSEIVNASGVAAVSICGLMLASERMVLTKTSKIVAGHFWNFITSIIDSLALTTMGFYVGWYYVWNSDFLDYVFIVLMYSTTYFGRFIILTILNPLTNKLGYNLDSRCRILAVCGSVPSLINMSYTLLPSLIQEIEGEVKSILFFYVSGMVILSLFLNVIILPYLAMFLKLNVVSLSRESELKLCMRHLRRSSMRELLFMKIESLMGETDWALVQSISNLENSYNKESWIQEGDEVEPSTRFCPDCNKELNTPMSYVEYPNQREASSYRILKAREAMQIDMYSKNLISKKSFIILNEILKEAYKHPNNYLQCDDLVKKFDVELICTKSCLNKFQTWQAFRFKPPQIRPPNFYWRRLCYHVIQKEVFRITIAGVILLNIVFIITEASLNPKPISEVKYAFTFFDVVFLIFYTSEWLINIAGRARVTFWKNGLTEYLRSPLNIFDFFVLITVWTSFIIETARYINLFSEIFIYENRLWFSLFKMVRVLRLIRFLKYAQSIVTKITEYYKNRKLLAAFDVGKDFFIQETTALKILPNICSSYRICCDLQEDIERNLSAVVRELHNVESNFSWISTTVKTTYAAKLVINSMRDTVEQLFVSGWIDYYEYASLNSILNNLLKRVKRGDIIQIPNREVIFENVSWMKGYPETTKALLEKIEIRKFEAGKCIFQEGDKSNGIYIIIIGVCDISYIPEEEKLSKLLNHGELPIVDNLLSGNFDKPINTYVTSGMTVGELSFLTDRQYSSKVTAYSPCETFFLSSEVLQEVMQIDSDPKNGLECRIWKNIFENMATGLLLRLTKIDSENMQVRDRYLTRFYVPKMDQSRCYDVENFIQDIVLVEGVIGDETIGKYYIAPCILPRKLRVITFPENEVVARLLFIHRENIEDSEIYFQKVKDK